MNNMHVYVVGNALLPYRITGDKNFFLDCFTAEWPANIDINIISYTGRKGKKTQLGPSTWLHELSRPLHHNEFQKYSGNSNGVPYFRHQHGRVRELIERSAMLLNTARVIRSISGGSESIVHYLDNFGPLMGPVGRMAGARSTTISSRPAAWPYGRISTEYVRRTTGSLDYVGASSEAWAAELANLGLDEMQVKRARWGVRPRDVNPKGPSVPRRLLWTGFIPLVGPNEFLLALRTAKEVLDVDPDVSFRFNFKPESWRNEFHGLSQPRIDIGVSQRPFAEQLLEADALFSPMAPGAILTPALSWLEAMAYEVPVVTSNVLGVEELIEDNWSGFVQRDGEELRHTVLRALESDFRRTGKNARYAVEEGFNLDQSINDLIALWEGA